MTNCCNEYGTCTQGRDCPARTCDDLGICQGRGDCACTQPVPPEAGNFQIIDLGPDDTPLYDGRPLTHDETMALVRLLLCWLLGVVVFFGGLRLLVSYGTERWADVIWAYLAQMS